jgi:hypothetical protein
MGARHYFPAQARWFQQDLYADALANLGLSTDPLNSNRYLFTGANPINYVELDGHAAGAVGPTYDGGTGDPDPTRQAGLMADAFVRLGCKSTQRAECAGAISGIEQQLRLYSNQKLLCAQTRDARHCTAGAGAKELLSIADTLTTFTGMGGITKTGIKFSVKKIIKEVAKRRAAKSLPRGFASADDFAEFGSSLRSGLKSAGYDDVTAYLQGSAVTRKSFRTGRAFDVGRVSDFDVALESSSLLAKASDLGIALRTSGTRTGPLSARDLQRLGLRGSARSLSAGAGRPVNFMVYGPSGSAAARGPSVLVP